MESGIESTVCVLVVVVVVVKWFFSVLEMSKVSQQGQQFIAQQGGGLTNSVKGLIFPNTSLVTPLNQHTSQKKCVIRCCIVSFFDISWVCKTHMQMNSR